MVEKILTFWKFNKILNELTENFFKIAKIVFKHEKYSRVDVSTCVVSCRVRFLVLRVLVAEESLSMMMRVSGGNLLVRMIQTHDQQSRLFFSQSVAGVWWADTTQPEQTISTCLHQLAALISPRWSACYICRYLTI